MGPRRKSAAQRVWMGWRRFFCPEGAATNQPRAERSGDSRGAPPWGRCCFQSVALKGRNNARNLFGGVSAVEPHRLLFPGGAWSAGVRVRRGSRRCAVLAFSGGRGRSRVPMKPRRKSGRSCLGRDTDRGTGARSKVRGSAGRWNGRFTAMLGDGFLGRAGIGLATCWRCRDRVPESGGTASFFVVAAWRSVCHFDRWSDPCFIRVSSVAGVSCGECPGLRLHSIGLAACMVWLDAHFSSLPAPPGIANGQWSLVIGHWSLVTGQRAEGHEPRTTNYKAQSTRHTDAPTHRAPGHRPPLFSDPRVRCR